MITPEQIERFTKYVEHFKTLSEDEQRKAMEDANSIAIHAKIKALAVTAGEWLEQRRDVHRGRTFLADWNASFRSELSDSLIAFEGLGSGHSNNVLAVLWPQLLTLEELRSSEDSDETEGHS